MFMVGKRRITVPKNLSTVTQIDEAAEIDPRDVGMTADGIGKIWSRTEKLYQTGVHPAVTLVVRRRGEIVMKRAIGCQSGNMPDEDGPAIPLDPDAPQCVFSASKAFSSLLIHKLAEDGKLSLNDLIAEHIPEFAQAGKGHISIRDLLCHRAGVPFIPKEHQDPALLSDWDAVIALICANPPVDGGNKRLYYHALTAGFIVGELVRRVAKMDIADAMREWIVEPLGCDYMTYGIAPEHRGKVARNAATGQRLLWPMTQYMRRVTAVPFEEAVMRSNEELFMDSVIPAGNMYASANDATKVFQMLLNGGEYNGNRILKPETIAEAIRPTSSMQIDRSLLFPASYSAGFMLGADPAGMFGPRSGDTYGHLGLLNILIWADPRRELSVALLNTGKTFAAAGVARLFQILVEINQQCSEV